MRILVQAGLSADLWHWLQEEGWREITHRPDRRAYRDIPASWVTRLIDASAEERPEILARAIAAARVRGPSTIRR